MEDNLILEKDENEIETNINITINDNVSQTKEDMIKRFIQHGYKLLKNANINITIKDNVSQTKEDMIKRFIQHGYKLLKNANINITINVAQNKEDNT